MYARRGRRSRNATTAPVLLPPSGSARQPLPGWLTIVALAGLALLLCSTVPAVLRRSRLATDLGQLHEEISSQEQEVRERERALHAAREDSFAHEQALRRLLHPLTTRTRSDGR